MPFRALLNRRKVLASGAVRTLPPSSSESVSAINAYLNGSSPSVPAGQKETSSMSTFPAGETGRSVNLSRLTLKPFAKTDSGLNLLRIGSYASLIQQTVTAAGFAAVASITVAGEKDGLSLTLTGGGTVVPGYYIINAETAVTHNTAGGTYYTCRELIRVTAVAGGVATLAADSALGRSYSGATLHNVSAHVITDCTFHMPRIKGFYGSINNRMTNPAYGAFLWGCSILGANVEGHSQTGLKLVLCRNCTVQSSTFKNSERSSTGYGLEMVACVDMTVTGDYIFNARKTNLLQGGCAKIRYQGASHDRGTISDANLGQIDLGHGFMEQDCTVANCTASGVIIGNPSYRLGAINHAVENCDLYFLQIDTGVDGLTVSETSSQLVIFNSEADDQDGLGTLGPISASFAGCSIGGGTYDSHTMYATGEGIMPESLTFTGCDFTSSTAASRLIASLNIQNPLQCVVTFEDCTFTSQSTKAYLSLFGSGNIQVNLNRCTFSGSSGSVVAVNGTVTAEVNIGASTLNGATITDSHVYVAGTATGSITAGAAEL